jgi:AcrR family transcriptional regulator
MQTREGNGMARPVTQDARRRDIVDAAITTLMQAEGGEVTIADVARRLDLTPNAIRYYYRDSESLLWAVQERVEQRFLTERRAALSQIRDRREQLVRAMGVGLPTGPEDGEWRVTFRPVMASRATPEFGEMLSDVFHRQAAIYEQVLVTGEAEGVFTLAAPATDIARTLMVMEDYLGFRVVMRDPAFSRPEALRLMRQYATLATGALLPELE